MDDFITKIAYLMNYILFILFLASHTNQRLYHTAESIVPLVIASCLLIDITYIAACNVRKNVVMSLFCGLLALDGWFLVISVEFTPVIDVAFKVLCPVIVFLSLKFIFMFLFQGNVYKYKKITDALLLSIGFGAVVGVFLSDRIFACLYGLQFLTSVICFFCIIVQNWKRVGFVLRNEKKPILISAGITMISFVGCYFLTIETRTHMSNFGLYVTVMLFFMSVHGIACKESVGIPISTMFSKRQMGILLSVSMAVISFVIVWSDGELLEVIVALNTMFALLFLYNIMLESNLKKENSRIEKNNSYACALSSLRQEEELKLEFSNFLHDEILQDLLSIKNIIGKSSRPEIREIITETLNDLNIRVKKEMQDYHPIISKNITLKENYLNLMEGISSSYPQQKIAVSFTCSDMLFLVEPYDVLIYRIMKELLTNVYKHADGTHAWITLRLEKDIIKLEVCDNGSAATPIPRSSDTKKHKGIASVTEQVENLGGAIIISDNIPYGICIQVVIPMKGDDSYKYFTS